MAVAAIAVQIHDPHVVDLHQWVCTRYLVGLDMAERVSVNPG